MKKPEALRAALVKHNRYIRDNPDQLHVFVDAGRLRSTHAAGAIGSQGGSFMYEYTLTIIVTDYPDDSATLMLPIVAWAADWQPELLANDDRQRDGIKFEAEIRTQTTADVQIEIKLTESVDVRYVEGNPTFSYRDEPLLDAETRAFLGV
ncbi:phage tail protein [Pandoraea nosoerga]|uniref:phage tail protein n=1 Tax=Pandoraea nosoerga TaxID=2508296 RepID=UPI00197D627F|nr:phage tail protein [Pandoraea nosoerga]MBN4667208.1 phage tail protein [Pandoraea nosoerga]MBN4677195.1 phage tail protein [Pandoraea nosoerga]MBN4681983.1 phage tail protein [Pandoraea nosoerga]MBN4746301.1 phage tail protein [Pandoraea nosoerga]